MNAAVRGVVRTALSRGVSVTGFYHGYDGILRDETVEMDSRSVGGIIALGGTVLRSARSDEFRTDAGLEKAHSNLKERGIDGLVVIGGDGSLAGALRLRETFQYPVNGVPGSIDNDISGTDFSVGFDTAVNTAVEAIDRVRDTAYSHERAFVIEVMGRLNGFIALEAGLAAGAEAVLIPEVPYRLEGIAELLRRSAAKGKKSCILVVAEGAARAEDVKVYLERHVGGDVRYLVLGHMQRGGTPTAFDRVLALRLGAHAVARLLDGFPGEMAGLVAGKLVSHPLSYVLSTERTMDPEKLALVDVMAQ